MRENEMLEKEEIFKGFTCRKKDFTFDVMSYKADDYYITITESSNLLKKMVLFTSKHKIYFHKEDFTAFTEILSDMTSYVLNHKGRRSTLTSKDFKKNTQ
jgi:hypothetical protein